MYSIASISKQFTASAIWRLVQDHKISLEDDIRLYLKEFPKYDTPIKIKHLLNHTSGIRNYHTLMFLSGFDYDRMYYDNETVYKLACKQKGLNNKPGELVAYSNTNYNLLALIIERISGMNLNDYLALKILKPLGMNHTFVRVATGKVIKNKAVGYQKRVDEFVYSVTNQLSYGAGSMGSNLDDMTLWLELLNGSIPKFKSLTNFLTKQAILHNGQLANYANGVMVDTYKGYKTISHSGFGFGGQSQIITVPELQIGIVVFTNIQSINPAQISYKIIDALLPEKVKEQIVKKTELFNVSQDLKLFVGDFKEINSDMKMTFTIENDTLKAKTNFGKFPVPLIATNNNKFTRLNSQNVKYDFTKTKEADLIISFGGTPFYFKRAKFINPENVKVKDFVGDFYSEELNVVYHFKIKDDDLVLNYKGNKNIPLVPIQTNQFGNNSRTLYHFEKDHKGQVTKMLLSCDGNVSNIEFVKQ